MQPAFTFLCNWFVQYFDNLCIRLQVCKLLIFIVDFQHRFALDSTRHHIPKIPSIDQCPKIVLDHSCLIFSVKIVLNSFLWKGLYISKRIGAISMRKNTFRRPYTSRLLHLFEQLLDFPGMIDSLTTRQRNVEKVSRP